MIPGGAAPHQAQPLRDLLAPGAQGGAAPEINDQGAGHLAVGLQKKPYHLVGGEPAEIHGRRCRQHTRVSREQVSPGGKNVATAA